MRIEIDTRDNVELECAIAHDDDNTLEVRGYCWLRDYSAPIPFVKKAARYDKTFDLTSLAPSSDRDLVAHIVKHAYELLAIEWHDDVQWSCATHFSHY